MASENWFENEEPTQGADAGFANGFSTRELLREITAKAALLARKEIELARAEIKHDFESEVATVKALAVAAVFAITTLNLLLVAAVFALTPYFEGWLAALVVAGSALLVAAVVGAIGWSRRVTHPLERTRRSIEEDVKWAKERLA
jgi:peptidoglycan/LPS O-acetylase OafA/YrhL